MMRMNRKYLKAMAENLGVPHKWRTNRIIRRNINDSLIHPSDWVTRAMRSCIGADAIGLYNSPGKVDVVISHHWWARPFMRMNLRVVEEIGRQQITTGATFNARAIAALPGWRVFAMVLVGITVASYLF